MKAKYVNPFTDFGFKKIFGKEASNHLLLDFLNALLLKNDQIAVLSFKNNEQLGLTSFDRKAIYDLYCENEKGEKSIVELQKAKQNYFKEERSIIPLFPNQKIVPISLPLWGRCQRQIGLNKRRKGNACLPDRQGITT